MIQTRWIHGEDDLTDAYDIRRKVFIEEQGVSEEEEMDGTDGLSVHLVVYGGNAMQENIPVACGRILVENGLYTLGRIAVLKEHRGKGYGDLVVRMLIRKAFDSGAEVQYIHSQLHARSFYEKLGFIAYGEEYEEAGIPHISMKHEGDVSGKCEN